jgi:FkbM family methyltransferase
MGKAGNMGKKELSVRGVIHVGANTGQERDYYRDQGLDVLWIEPDYTAFRQLRENIAFYPNQHAIWALITDKEFEHYTFHITGNSGLSSSIYPLKEHRNVWPDVHEVLTKQMCSYTLDSIFEEGAWNLTLYNKLVIDTQGADLLVLKGATKTLKHMNYVQVEVSPLELYEGGCLENEVTDYLNKHGFTLIERQTIIEDKVYENLFARWDLPR